MNLQSFYKDKISKSRRKDIILIACCLEVILAFSYLGYFDVEPISITTMHILVIVMAMLMGNVGSVPVAIVFALTSMWKASTTATTYQDILFSPLRSGYPIQSILLILPRILFAIITSYLFKVYFAKERKYPTLSIVVISILSTIIHGLLVMISMYLLFSGKNLTFAQSVVSEIFVSFITAFIVLLTYRFFSREKIQNFFEKLSHSPSQRLTKSKNYYVSIFIFLFLAIMVILHYIEHLLNLLGYNETIVYFLTEENDGQLLVQFVVAMLCVSVIVITAIDWINRIYNVKLRALEQTEFNEKQYEYEKKMNEELKKNQLVLIEQKKQLEVALAESNLNNEIISAISKVYWIIYRMDLETGTYEEVSSGEEMHRLTGKTGKVSEAFGEAIDNVVSKDFQNMMLAFLDTTTLSKRLENKESIYTEYLAKDGKWHLSGFIVKRRNSQNKVTNVLYVVTEINETKQKELQYLSAIEALELDYTASYICDLNRDEIEPFKVTKGSLSEVAQNEDKDCIRSFSTWIRYSWDNILIHESCPNFLKDYDVENLKNVLKNQDSMISRHETKPNTYGNRYFEMRVVRMHSEEGSFKIILGYRPIDQIIRSEQEQNQKLQAINEELRKQQIETIKANNAKTEFLRRMSHDIRTPINGIRGILQISSHYPYDFARQEEWREKMMTASGYLLELVNNILDMSKLESGEVKLEYKSFDLVELLRETNEITRLYGAESGITFIVNKGNIQHTKLIGSPTHLQQVLLNVSSNAIKYNKAGGTVTVDCNEISCKDDVCEFEFTCTDTGIGMSEEYQKHIFEPFSQEDGGARTTYVGSGLGMPIAKQLVELQGGSLTFESKENEGTKFIIRVPFELDHTVVQETPIKVTERIDGVKVLLVEDNDLNMEIAECLLEEKGAEITKAFNGQEAVDLFKASSENTYDVILMDIMMPVLSGLEASKEIRALDRKDAKDIPIIAMSANAFQDDIDRSLRAGMNAHITKPLDIDKVIEVITKYKKL